MPIYEYRCSKCGDFEVMQKIMDKDLRTCPTCRRKVTKLISNTTFHLKGSGWYATDYARKSQREAKTGDKMAETKSESKNESKSDGKAESKSESKTSSGKSAEKDTKAKSVA